MASVVIAIPKFCASSFVDRSLCVKKKLWEGSGVRFGGRRKTAAGSGGRGGDPVWSGRQRNLKTKKFEVQAQAKKGGSSGDKAPRSMPFLFLCVLFLCVYVSLFRDFFRLSIGSFKGIFGYIRFGPGSLGFRDLSGE